jgi:tetratricopeptide (TPR) repeat protein
MYFQNAGMSLEKEGKNEDAAQKYEKAIDFGSKSKCLRANNYFHSVERLVIVYRKLKRYDDEIRVINMGLSMDISESDKSKLLSRLEKVETLKKRK